ncbi:MAG: hypothetical protein ACFFD2_23190 [Promethearchaeota archaeon]
MSEIFDVKRKCEGLGILKDVYEDFVKEVRLEFPNDEMMFELHLLRALMAYSDKRKEK